MLGVLRTYQSRPLVPGRDVLFSETSWPRFLARLGKYAHAADLTIWPLDGRGYPVHRGYAHISIRRDSHLPEWYRFTFAANADDTSWPDAPGLQDHWAALVKRHAAAMSAYAGGMNDDIGWNQATALQRTAMRSSLVTDQSSDFRSVLRGYSWITIVGSEPATRLGGTQSLVASGAFCEVAELPNGAIWLRATPTINEFTGEKIRAVFETLAPELPTGMPKIWPTEEYRIVEGVDAANYQ
ncbi:MAG TPA: hypothetical protein VEL03_01235 [Streptosporangiaceae bacterium]|nr:hypothetical protein [Streptosporangiaceae bacterium]